MKPGNTTMHAHFMQEAMCSLERRQHDKRPADPVKVFAAAMKLALILFGAAGLLPACAHAEPEGRDVVTLVDTKLSEAEKKRWLATECNDGRPEFMECVEMQGLSMPPLDPSRREHFGERYDPQEWLACMRRGYARRGIYGTGGCEPYRLRRIENPEYWPNPAVPPFRWPDPPAQTVYREGMSSKEYFDALCKAEAGEFFFKPVEGKVEGLYQIRPRAMEDGNPRQEDRYVMEDPYGYTLAESHFVMAIMLHGDRLRFFETPPSPVAADKGRTLKPFYHPTFSQTPPQNTTVYRYSMDWSLKRSDSANGVPFEQKTNSIKREYLIYVESRYGYTWRGISRFRDRELGIAGGELALIDLTTNTLVALKRGFVMSGTARTETGIRWESARRCPLDHQQPTTLLSAFIDRTLNRKIEGASN